jgi:small subunit ribosomal protein S16
VAVRLRLKRTGRKHVASYRVVAMDSRAPRDGRAIEELGWYQPENKDADKQLSLKPDRIREWLTKGAQPTETVALLCLKAGIELPAKVNQRVTRRPKHHLPKRKKEE